MITDFDPGGDKIDLSGLKSIVSFADMKNNHRSFSDGNAIIDGGNGDVLVLVGIVKADLHAGDFLF